MIMKRFLLSLITALFVCLSINAQLYNSVFPIVNTVPKNQPEFVGANISLMYEYLGKPIYVVDFIGQYAGGKQITSQVSPDGYSFISFNYVTKNDGLSVSLWNGGSESTQILFHPGNGGYHSTEYAIANTTYGFIFSETEGLFLCDVNGMNIVAKLDDGTDILNYAFLSVYAGKDYVSNDVIVVAGKNRFKVFETIPSSSGVRQIFSSSPAPSYFDINGQRLDAPKQGINIVVDGNESKKIVVK